MRKTKPQEFLVVQVDEQGKSRVMKRGFSARQTSLGHFIFDPRDPADGHEKAEWFATAGRRSYLRLVE